MGARPLLVIQHRRRLVSHCADPLLFALGEVIARMELTLEFVQFLLAWLLSLPGKMLTGQAPTDDPLAGNWHRWLKRSAPEVPTSSASSSPRDRFS